MGDKSLERFRVEYEKLHAALKKSHENEKKLIRKCKELNAELVVNAAKVQSALRMSRSDQNNITLLKKVRWVCVVMCGMPFDELMLHGVKEIDNAWKIVDAAQEKEKRAKETIQRLKGEIEKLSRIVDQGAGLSIGQENAVCFAFVVHLRELYPLMVGATRFECRQVNELLKQKDELTKELENQQSMLAAEQAKTKEFATTIADMEKDKFIASKEMHELSETNSKLKVKAERESRRAERLQAEMMVCKLCRRCQ